MGDQPISTWNPTPEQRKKYTDREAALCHLALKRDPSLLQTHTLFSPKTWARVMRERHAAAPVVQQLRRP